MSTRLCKAFEKDHHVASANLKRSGGIRNTVPFSADHSDFDQSWITLFDLQLHSPFTILGPGQTKAKNGFSTLASLLEFVVGIVQTLNSQP
mmetsp:Transcript_5953/g.10758  ORF Transcript_5953/g.10758 Transcript_5953/m.10758 type:complete len:91 (-) Transcript_5953:163-435(-)